MLLIGVDQGSKKHDVHVMDTAGIPLLQFTIDHTQVGFEYLHHQRAQLNVPSSDCLVALESGYSLLVDYLLDQGYPVYVIPGKAVDRYRDRYRQSRSRSDHSDAQLLGHVLRTDRAMYTPLTVDQPLTYQLRSQVKLLLNLKRTILNMCNQLRNLLWRYYPVAAHLFKRLDQQLSLRFIQSYPTPQAVEQLSYAEFADFCHTHHYYHSKYITRRYAQLLQIPDYSQSATTQAYSQQTQVMVRILLLLIQERKNAQQYLSQLFKQHPDAYIFNSLPGAGAFLAPALLAKFRDCRSRFPTAAVVQAIAGTCPVTIQSGKKRRVRFRRACDHEFRYIITQFARISVRQSPWAAAYFVRVRSHCDKASAAYRRLANRWAVIIWRLWTDRVAYDEALHLRHTFMQRPVESLD